MKKREKEWEREGDDQTNSNASKYEQGTQSKAKEIQQDFW